MDGQVLRRVLYFANWGTNVLKLRLPSSLLDKRTANLYCVGESASARGHKGKAILTFASDDEEIDEWPDESDALSALIPIRTQIAAGDFRSLYIGWLLSAQTGELEDEEVEPPVPQGLGDLDGSLERLVDFLRIDTERRRVSHSEDCRHASTRAARDLGDERRSIEAARAEIEKTRREQEAASARSKHLDDLARKEPAVWKEIDSLIATKQPANYDRAVSLLVDLRDLAAKQSRESSFLDRLDVLRAEHARKPSFIAKLQRAGLC